MIWKLYESHAQPSTRIAHGVPFSWDQNAAATTRPYTIGLAVWSSSSRFIAIAPNRFLFVEILDSVTLQRLQSLEGSREEPERAMALAFSPDGHMLSCASDLHRDNFVSTWDLQTGGLISDVKLPFQHNGVYEGDTYITYSMNGKMVGTLHLDGVTATISIIDVVSGVHTHIIDPGTLWTNGIWTHGESLRFATTAGAKITIWEVGFAQGATQREIETLSIPDDDADQAGASDQKTQQFVGRTQFFFIPCRLAFTHAPSGPADELLVWNPRNSVRLLQDTSARWYPRMTFSSDGRLFACSTTGLEIYLWKESSTGYALIGKLQSNTRRSIPLLSPNGESIITFRGQKIQLWHTKAFTTPSSISAHIPRCSQDFVLQFVPDRKLAVVARPEEKTVTILDLKSGLPQMTIDSPMEVSGFRVIENTVVVIGDGRIITWNLPEGNSPPHTRVGVENSTQTTYLSNEQQQETIITPASLGLHHIVLLRRNPKYHETYTPSIYCSLTGRLIYAFRNVRVTSLLFHSSENGVWCIDDDMVSEYKIKWHGSNPRWNYSWTNIKYLSFPCPWRSSRGYKVTENGWLICPDGKRLFMLPPPWRSHATQRVWDGQFLALLDGALPQPVILDLEP